MVWIYLMKLAHKWILRHKLRYLLSWISFALVSIILISIYSLGFSIQSGIKDQIKVNPQNYQISIKNFKLLQSDATVQRDLTESIAEDIKQNSGSDNMRILYDSSLFIYKINGTAVEQSRGKVSFSDVEYPLLLNNDVEYISYSMPSSTDFGFNGRLFNETDTYSAVVTNTFIESYNLSNDEILGTVLTLKDEFENEYSFTVIGVLSCADKLPILMNSAVFLPYTDNTIESIKSDLPLSIVTFDYSSDTDMEKTEQLFSNIGYDYSRPINDAATINSLSNSIAVIGSLIGFVLLGLSSIGLINSILVTINENAAFMNFFRIIGLNRSKYSFIICYTAILQGIVGGIIGSLCAFIFQSQILSLFQLLGIRWDMLLGNFKIEPVACILVFLFCIAISIITSLLSLLRMKNHITIAEIYTEN